MENLKKYTIAIDQDDEDIKDDYILVIEKDLNNRICEKVISKLKDLQANVIATQGDNLEERCNMANKAKANLLISIGSNVGTSMATGITTYIYKNYKNPITKQLGENLQEQISTNEHFLSLGLKLDNSNILRCTNMPAALVELGFFTNTEEERTIQSDEFQDEISDNIVSAIILTLKT